MIHRQSVIRVAGGHPRTHSPVLIDRTQVKSAGRPPSTGEDPPKKRGGRNFSENLLILMPREIFNTSPA